MHDLSYPPAFAGGVFLLDYQVWQMACYSQPMSLFSEPKMQDELWDMKKNETG